MRIRDYELIRQLGEGGFGRTYEALHVGLDAKACLKQNINITDDDAELLRKEARILYNNPHHSLPSVHDFFRHTDGSHIMVMGFAEGKGLEKVIAKHTALHPEEVCWISQRLLNALYYLHCKGIVHGDVKPSNVIVNAKEHNAVLIDLGLASIHPNHTTKSSGYTKIFSAPEVIAGRPPLPESDLYGLGATMIYALGGDPNSKALPEYIPGPLRDFCNSLVHFNPLDRPNWEKQDLISALSNVREDVFGRKISFKQPIVCKTKED